MPSRTKSKKSAKAAASDLPPLHAEDAEPVKAPKSPPKADVETLEKEIESLKTELVAEQEKSASHWDRLLRKEAEAQNIKKRADQSIADARRFAIGGFAESLLVVIDSFEKGLELAEAAQTDEIMLEGMRLTYGQFLDILSNNQIEVLDPKGETFDPNEHEALSMIPSDELPANQIVEVIQKGYRLHQRLLRPAKVIVAKAAK